MTAKPQKLRHGARDANQEYLRDCQMRAAIKVVDEQVIRAWHAVLRANPSRSHREIGPIQATARAEARKTLRERWAKEDAKFVQPLAPGLTRMTPADLRENEALDATRRAYVAEVRKLNKGARRTEAKRLTQALEKVEREVKERDAAEWARTRAPYEWEKPREPRGFPPRSAIGAQHDNPDIEGETNDYHPE